MVGVDGEISGFGAVKIMFDWETCFQTWAEAVADRSG